MIQETINVVKETEEKAEKIVKDARQQADAMVAKAKEDAKLFKEAQLKRWRLRRKKQKLSRRRRCGECKRRLLHLGRRRRRKNHRPLRP